MALALTDGATDVGAEDGVTGDTEPDSVGVATVAEGVVTGVTATEVAAVEGVAEIDSSGDGVALIVSTTGGTVAAADGATDRVEEPESLPLAEAEEERVAEEVEVALGEGEAVTVGITEPVETTEMTTVGSWVESGVGVTDGEAASEVVAAGVTTTVTVFTVVTPGVVVVVVVGVVTGVKFNPCDGKANASSKRTQAATTCLFKIGRAHV